MDTDAISYVKGLYSATSQKSVENTSNFEDHPSNSVENPSKKVHHSSNAQDEATPSVTDVDEEQTSNNDI